MTIKASRLRKSRLPTTVARLKMSYQKMALATKLNSAVSLIIAMNSLPVGGMMTLNACGSTTRRIRCR